MDKILNLIESVSEGFPFYSCIFSRGQTTKMAAIPINILHLKDLKSSSQNHRADCLETWYVVFPGGGGGNICINDDPSMTLTYLLSVIKMHLNFNIFEILVV